MGLASLLVSFVTRAAASLSPPANLYVVATEDSCVYWMGRGYVLEVSERLNARLNVFNDTHLLRQAGDPEDAGDEADLPRRRDQPWAQLSAAERRHASRLGFTPESWDADTRLGRARAPGPSAQGGRRPWRLRPPQPLVGSAPQAGPPGGGLASRRVPPPTTIPDGLDLEALQGGAKEIMTRVQSIVTEVTLEALGMGGDYPRA